MVLGITSFVVTTVTAAVQFLFQLCKWAMKPNNDTVQGIEDSWQRPSSGETERNFEAHRYVQAAQQKVADAERSERAAKEAHRQGKRPFVEISKEQLAATKRAMRYDESKLHFAVCGSAGAGKSTFINAVRGLEDGEYGAAKVDVTECTSNTTRYPDPRNHDGFSRFVWYDIPGAGTATISDWQYFIDQGLYVCDFIILMYNDRFMAIDEHIIENCINWGIPVFIVRSKADQHIDNMVKAAKCKPGQSNYNYVRSEMKKKFVAATKLDFGNHMKRMADTPGLKPNFQEQRRVLLGKIRIYLCSRDPLRELMLMTMRRGGGDVDESEFIDEHFLLRDMMISAGERRCK